MDDQAPVSDRTVRRRAIVVLTVGVALAAGANFGAVRIVERGGSPFFVFLLLLIAAAALLCAGAVFGFAVATTGECDSSTVRPQGFEP